MFGEMGIFPTEEDKRKKPALKTVALAVLASVRMQRLQKEWAPARRLKEDLLRKAEQTRRVSRRSNGRVS